MKRWKQWRQNLKRHKIASVQEEREENWCLNPLDPMDDIPVIYIEITVSAHLKVFAEKIIRLTTKS